MLSPFPIPPFPHSPFFSCPSSLWAHGHEKNGGGRFGRVERVQSVLIVGGGSSGWMTAQALKANLPELQVTLVEASDIPTVGVGEATLNTLHGFLLPAGIHEDEFLYETGGSIKLGILYRGWSDRDYWHPFGEVWFPPTYLERWMHDRSMPFDEYGGLGTFELARA